MLLQFVFCDISKISIQTQHGHFEMAGSGLHSITYYTPILIEMPIDKTIFFWKFHCFHFVSYQAMAVDFSFLNQITAID